MIKKKKRNIFPLFFLFIITACFFLSCNEPPENESIHTSSVVRQYMAEHGNYIYTECATLYRYNWKTNHFSAVCADPECPKNTSADCPLCGGWISNPLAVVDNKLFFFSDNNDWDSKYYFGYQDLLSGEVTLLKSLSETEQGGRIAFIYDGYLYYTCIFLTENGDPSNPEDYRSAVKRITLDGSVDEFVLYNEGGLSMVAEGRLITEDSGRIYTTDIQTREKSLLFDAAAEGYKNASVMMYSNGYLFLSTLSHLSETVKYTNVKYPLFFLIALDLSTGEWSQIIDEPIANFTVTEDRVYYHPFDIQYIYLPENMDELYEKNPQYAASLVKTYACSAEFFSCNFDGSDSKLIFKEDHPISFNGVNGAFTVIDNRVYGWLHEYDKETHKWNDWRFGSVNLDTGEVTYCITDSKDE